MPRFFILSFAILVAVGLGCKKNEPSPLVYRVHQLPVTAKVRAIRAFGADSLMMVGGDVNSTGFVLRMDTGLSSSELLFTDIKSEVYDASIFQGRWYFGLDSTQLLYSDDLLSLHTLWWKQHDWVNDLHKQPIRRFANTDSTLVAVAGGELAFGVVYCTFDQGQRWNPLELEHEFRAACAVSANGSETFWAAGNGALLRRTTGDASWTRLEFDHAYITDLHFSNHVDGFALTYSGELYQTKDGGNAWKQILKPKREVFANRLAVSPNGTAVIACNHGWFALSRDHAETWTWYHFQDGVHLNDCVVIGSSIIFACEEGKIIQLDLNGLS